MPLPDEKAAVITVQKTAVPLPLAASSPLHLQAPASPALMADRRTALNRLWQLATLALGGSAAAGLVACGGGGTPAPVASSPPPGPTPPPVSSPPPPAAAPAAANTFATGLQNPWGMAFLPDGRILVTQRTGSLVVVSANGQAVSAVSGAPTVDSSGQGGLLDVALDPDFSTSGLVFLTFSESGSGGTAGTAVARGQLVGNALQNVSVIFRQSPKISGNGHYGSRLAFRGDKTLFVTLGERQQDDPANPTTANAQNLTKHLGKVVRINRDGSVPTGNPSFAGVSGALPEIWSYGHRNPQGAAIHPTTGELWQSEHGPQGGDEINISRAGSNYGWPLRSYGCPYGAAVNGNDNSACRVGGGTHAPAYVEPLTLATWTPFSVAPSGLAFYTGTMFPEWQGNLFMGALAGMALWRLKLNGNTVESQEPLFASLNERIRDVRQGPDGVLYLLTDGGSARIVRVAR